MIILIVIAVLVALSLVYFAANHGEEIHGMLQLIESSWKKEDEKDL